MSKIAFHRHVVYGKSGGLKLAVPCSWLAAASARSVVANAQTPGTAARLYQRLVTNVVTSKQTRLMMQLVGIQMLHKVPSQIETAQLPLQAVFKALQMQIFLTTSGYKIKQSLPTYLGRQGVAGRSRRLLAGCRGCFKTTLQVRAEKPLLSILIFRLFPFFVKFIHLS